MEEKYTRAGTHCLYNTGGWPMGISFQQRLHSTKALSNTVEAGLLACNSFTVLPIQVERTVDNWGKNLFVTYSCGTACDSHTIPY